MFFQSFRIQLDKKREMFDHLSEAEKADLKESIRLFRNPFEGEGGSSSLGEKYNGMKNNPYRCSLNKLSRDLSPNNGIILIQCGSEYQTFE